MSEERQDPATEEQTTAAEVADAVDFSEPPENDPEDPPDEDYPVEGQ